RALEVGPHGDRHSLSLKVAEFFTRIGRPDDAVSYLVPLLVTTPPLENAHDIARQMLADPRLGEAVALKLEGLATEGLRTDEDTAAGLFETLIEAREATARMPEARRRWFRSAVELSKRIPVLSLPSIVRGALDLPNELPLWEAAERIGRELGQLTTVVGA